MYINSLKSESGRWDTLIASVFSLIFFIGRIGDGGLRSDNVLYASISKSVLTGDNPLILHMGHFAYLNKPPLFFWINAFFIKIFGSGVFSAKIASALAAALLSILIFKIARDVFRSSKAGYAAMLFFCLNYIVFKNSHACRPESMMTLFIVAGYLMTGKYCEGKNVLSLIFAGILFGMVVMIKGYIGLLAFACAVVFILMKRKNFSAAKLMFDIIAASIFFAAVFVWWYAYILARTDFYNTFFQIEIMGRLINNGINFRHDPIYRYAVKFVPYSIIMLPFLIIGLKQKFSLFFDNAFVGSSGLFALIYLIGIHFISTKYDRYLYPVIPLFSIIAAGGFLSIFSFSLRSTVVAIAACLAVFFCTFPGKTGNTDYTELTGLQKTAELNGGKLCVSPGYLSYWERMAAVSYFTDEYKTDKCTDKDIYINFKDAFCDGYLLEQNNKFSACTKAQLSK